MCECLHTDTHKNDGILKLNLCKAALIKKRNSAAKPIME